MNHRSSRDRVWAITSYFPFDDPVATRRRLTAFRQFRARLGVPLAAIELTRDAAPHLGPDDAEVLVRAWEGDVLWQKERLLNVALDALPDECDTVAWIDCDVILENPNWPGEARQRLREVRLLQPFRRVTHLPAPGLPTDNDRTAPGRSLDAVAYRQASGTLPDEVHSRRGLSLHLGYAPGMAWVTRRELLAHHRFYDGAILGSGDKLMFSAACGRIDEAVSAFGMPTAWGRHFESWARGFHSAIRGEIGYLEGDAWHLWHGDLGQRGYGDRYAGFGAHAFDPDADLRIGPDGAWQWNSAKPALHAYVQRYFSARASSDGTAAA